MSAGLGVLPVCKPRPTDAAAAAAVVTECDIYHFLFPEKGNNNSLWSSSPTAPVINRFIRRASGELAETLWTHSGVLC